VKKYNIGYINNVPHINFGILTQHYSNYKESSKWLEKYGNSI